MADVNLTITIPNTAVPKLVDYVKSQYDPAEIQGLNNKQVGEKYIEDHFLRIYESLEAAEAGRQAMANQESAVAEKEQAVKDAEAARKTAEQNARDAARATFGRA